jgi:hypothetical protein
MRNFHKINPAIWQSARFRTLPSDDARYLFIYFFTNAHQTSAGAYFLHDGYACVDLDWDATKLRATRDTLIMAGMVQFDETTSEIFIVEWFAHNPPMNPKHVSGTAKQIDSLQSEKLKMAARESLARLPPPGTPRRNHG